MIFDGLVPERVITFVAAATIFTVMFTLGLGIVLREFRGVAHSPGLVARALFAVLVAVPVLAVLVVRSLDLPRSVQVGIVLMAMSPGAPMALRRSIGAGGHRAFAPALQILVSLLAVVSMPLWVAALAALYAGDATVAPQDVALQVFKAQLLPLGLGMLVRRFAPGWAAWVEPRLGRLAGLLLAALLLLVLVDVMPVLAGASWRVVAAIVLVTLLALGTGHLLGGSAGPTRTATAICSAARNPGLALLVATQNAASQAGIATVLVYLVVSALVIVPYITWSRRVAAVQAGAPPPQR
ncbi:bile acid:sodium symporter family protein [Sphaerotilaceae bacterium SBD11-9]